MYSIIYDCVTILRVKFFTEIFVILRGFNTLVGNTIRADLHYYYRFILGLFLSLTKLLLKFFL